MKVPEKPRELDVHLAAILLSPLSTAITDLRLPDNPIIAVNEPFCQLTGYSHDEVVGRNCRFLGGSETELDAKLALKAAIESGGSKLVEITNYRKDGTKFRNAVMIAPMRDASGAISHFVGSQVAVDHVEQKITGSTQIPKAILDRLSSRQREVLALMVNGLRNRQIAETLGIGERTVKIHRALVLEKLEAKTTSDAIRIAVKAGLNGQF